MQLSRSARPLGEPPLGLVCAAALFFLPLGAHLVETGAVELDRCGMKQAFELPCFSCGSTRATIALFHGDLVGALGLQPLTMLIYLLTLVWGAGSLTALLTRRSVRLRLDRREKIVALSLVLLLPLVNWIYLYQAGI